MKPIRQLCVEAFNAGFDLGLEAEGDWKLTQAGTDDPLVTERFEKWWAEVLK